VILGSISLSKVIKGHAPFLETMRMEKIMGSQENYAKEREIIRRLLSKKNIQEYEIVLLSGEGKELPGSTYEDEIELTSGTIVTATAAYGFWLDWIDDHYTLGDEQGYWYEVNINEFRDADDILAAQQRLRQKGQ
jgi:hypothetical protein